MVEENGEVYGRVLNSPIHCVPSGPLNPEPVGKEVLRLSPCRLWWAVLHFGLLRNARWDLRGSGRSIPFQKWVLPRRNELSKGGRDEESDMGLLEAASTNKTIPLNAPSEKNPVAYICGNAGEKVEEEFPAARYPGPVEFRLPAPLIALNETDTRPAAANGCGD